jgi:hypothetical protein
VRVRVCACVRVRSSIHPACVCVRARSAILLYCCQLVTGQYDFLAQRFVTCQRPTAYQVARRRGSAAAATELLVAGAGGGGLDVQPRTVVSSARTPAGFFNHSGHLVSSCFPLFVVVLVNCQQRLRLRWRRGRRRRRRVGCAGLACARACVCACVRALERFALCCGALLSIESFGVERNGGACPGSVFFLALQRTRSPARARLLERTNERTNADGLRRTGPGAVGRHR